MIDEDGDSAHTFLNFHVIPINKCPYCGGPNDGQVGLGSTCSCNTDGDGPGTGQCVLFNLML